MCRSVLLKVASRARNEFFLERYLTDAFLFASRRRSLRSWSSWSSLSAPVAPAAAAAAPAAAPAASAAAVRWCGDGAGAARAARAADGGRPAPSTDPKTSYSVVFTSIRLP